MSLYSHHDDIKPLTTTTQTRHSRVGSESGITLPCRCIAQQKWEKWQRDRERGSETRKCLCKRRVSIITATAKHISWSFPLCAVDPTGPGRHIPMCFGQLGRRPGVVCETACRDGVPSPLISGSQWQRGNPTSSGLQCYGARSAPTDSSYDTSAVFNERNLILRSKKYNSDELVKLRIRINGHLVSTNLTLDL